MIRTLTAAALALLPALALAADVPPRLLPEDGAQLMTQDEYMKGLEKLRGYLEKRGEDPAVAERFIADLQSAFQVAPGRSVPVTRDVFALFLKSEASWARKTRDRKNENVTPDQRAHEVERHRELRDQFKKQAAQASPRFYRAFQTAVRDVRANARAAGPGAAVDSADFFGDHIDDAYSHIDAGDEAIEKGDAQTAVAEANQALAQSPANADAFILRAGAQYEQGNTAAAVADAQTALALAPDSQQAQAIVSLSGTPPAAAETALLNAAAYGTNLADDGREASPNAIPVLAPASATPAVGAMLSTDMTSRAVKMASVNTRASIEQLDQAMALDPHNSAARSWSSTLSNRIGDYTAALASAEQSLTRNAEDAGSYFNKAYALAGTGDKDGMVDALASAARLDSRYQPVLDQAQPLSREEDMKRLFSESAARFEPPVPLPRRRGTPLMAIIVLAAMGALLAAAGGAQLYYKNT